MVHLIEDWHMAILRSTLVTKNEAMKIKQYYSNKPCMMVSGFLKRPFSIDGNISLNSSCVTYFRKGDAYS